MDARTHWDTSPPTTSLLPARSRSPHRPAGRPMYLDDYDKAVGDVASEYRATLRRLEREGSLAFTDCWDAADQLRLAGTQYIRAGRIWRNEYGFPPRRCSRFGARPMASAIVPWRSSRVCATPTPSQGSQRADGHLDDLDEGRAAFGWRSSRSGRCCSHVLRSHPSESAHRPREQARQNNSIHARFAHVEAS